MKKAYFQDNIKLQAFMHETYSGIVEKAHKGTDTQENGSLYDRAANLFHGVLCLERSERNEYKYEK